jgi:hypothetical protein
MKGIPDTLFHYVKNECESVDYGTVRIEINSNRGEVDVVTERRERFPREKKAEKESGSRETRHG